MNNFYVYIYLDPRKPGKYEYGDYCFLYEPFYVGKGTRRRWKMHLEEHSLKIDSFKNRKIKNILKEGYDLKKYNIKIFKNISNIDASKIEIELIKIIGRHDLKEGPLTNHTDGGEGCSGRIVSEETKRKLSESHMGKKMSKEARKKMSESKKGSKSWNKGKKGLQEAWNKGKKASDEAIANQSIGQKNRKDVQLICDNCKHTFNARTNNRKYCNECINKYKNKGYSYWSCVQKLNKEQEPMEEEE